MRARSRGGVLLLVLLSLLAPLPRSVATRAQAPVGERELRVAVDLEIQRSGLADHLLPPFQAPRRVHVALRGVSSREALELGAAGAADVVWVHAPRLEAQYLNQGFYLDRRLVLYTDYVLAGPPRDPARVKGTRRVVLAFRRIAQSKAPFVSRGERAGSYLLEQELWKKAGVTPEAPWYSRVGGPQKEALALAATQEAYLLMDRSSVEPLLDSGQLQILLQGVRPLRSGYHVMDVNPHRFPKVNYQDARAFGDYLLSSAVQETIRTFSADGDGKPVFLPGAGKREADL